MEARWRIQLLGGLRVERAGEVVTHFRTRKTAELLAYLAYYRARPHPREVLIELLSGCYEHWIVPEQQRLDELSFQALHQLIADLEQAGDPATALQYALRATGVNRLREEAHREVIRLYAASGQPAAALRQYREL